MSPIDLKFFYLCMLGLFSLLFSGIGTWLCKRAIETKDNNAVGAGMLCFLGVGIMLLLAASVAGVSLK